MEALNALNGRLDSLIDDSIITNSFKEGENADGDHSTDLEAVVLNDLDSYTDDLDTCLRVSRMVNDYVVRGVIQEANEKIASKEMQIDVLNEKLHQYELNAAKSRFCSPVTQVGFEGLAPEMEVRSIDLCMEQIHSECLSSLKVAAAEQLQKLKNEIRHVNHASLAETKSPLGSGGLQLCNIFHQSQVQQNLEKMEKSTDALRVILDTFCERVDELVFLFKNSILDHQSKCNFQKEVETIIVQNFVMGLDDEFQEKLCMERKLLGSSNINFSKMFHEILQLRKELEVITKSLSSYELGHLGSQDINENCEEWSGASRKDNLPHMVPGNHSMPYASQAQEYRSSLKKKNNNPMPEAIDSRQLLHMSKEELISYFKSEMTKMKRHHESALQEKTEELFMAKREILKGKGSLPVKKDREYEILRKKIQEIILKLDSILLEVDMHNVAKDGSTKLCNVKERVSNLFLENQRLRDLLADKRRGLKCLSQKPENKMSCHAPEEINLEQINTFGWDVEDTEIGMAFRNDIHRIFMKDWVEETKNHIKTLELEVKYSHEIYSIMLKGFLGDFQSFTNTITMGHDEVKRNLESTLLQKDKLLCLEIEKTKKLENDLELVSRLLEEKQKLKQEAESILMQQKEHFEEVCKELNVLRDQISKREIILSENKKETDLINLKLNNALDQVHLYEKQMSKLDENLRVALSELKEAEKEKSTLHSIILVKQVKESLAVAAERAQREHIRSLIFSLLELAMAFDKFESKLTESIHRNNTRLGAFNDHIDQIRQQADELRGEISWHKQRFEIKSSNLQKAEAEVDILGDEVDALLSVLAKIYVALDHYSPILQHYPAITEILKLVKRELLKSSKTS